jgi:DNA topoisomerase-1
VVTAFLVDFLTKYVEYDFTANLEEDLDKVADGQMDWKNLMRNFWGDFHETVKQVEVRRTSEVIDELNKSLSNYLFPTKSHDGNEESDEDARKCKKCSNGTLGLKLSKFGAFIACSNYPECDYKCSVGKEFEAADESEREVVTQESNRILGYDGDDPILLKKGPYGYYVQRKESYLKGEKPVRNGLPAGYVPEQMTLEIALNLLSLPKVIGVHPETKEELSIGIGKYGPYVKCGKKFTSIPKEYDPFVVDLQTALVILADAANNKKKPKK